MYRKSGVLCIIIGVLSQFIAFSGKGQSTYPIRTDTLRVYSGSTGGPTLKLESSTAPEHTWYLYTNGTTASRIGGILKLMLTPPGNPAVDSVLVKSAIDSTIRAVRLDPGGVTSVNGQTGAVELGIDDVLQYGDTALRPLYFNTDGFSNYVINANRSLGAGSGFTGFNATFGTGITRQSALTVSDVTSQLRMANATNSTLFMNANTSLLDLRGSFVNIEFRGSNNTLNFNFSGAHNLDLGTNGLGIRNGSAVQVGKLFNDGRHQGAPATAANEFVTRQQVTDSLNERMSTITVPTLQEVTAQGNTTPDALIVTGTSALPASGKFAQLSYNTAADVSILRSVDLDLGELLPIYLTSNFVATNKLIVGASSPTEPDVPLRVDGNAAGANAIAADHFTTKFQLDSLGALSDELNLLAFGGVPDFGAGNTDNTGPLNAAFAAAADDQRVVIPAGDWYFASGITLPADKRVYLVCYGNMHFDAEGITATGHLFKKTVEIYGTLVGNSTGTGMTVTNCYNGDFHIKAISGFERGLLVQGNGAPGSPNGSQYNKISWQTISTVDSGIVVTTTGGAANWANENQFFGGRISAANAITFLQGTGQTDPFNGNKFYNVGLEACTTDGINLEFAVSNQFINCRLSNAENTAPKLVTLAADAQYNVFDATLYEADIENLGLQNQFRGTIFTPSGVVSSQVNLGADPTRKSVGLTGRYSSTAANETTNNSVVLVNSQFPNTTFGSVALASGEKKQVAYEQPYQFVNTATADLEPNIGWVRVNATGTTSLTIDAVDVVLSQSVGYKRLLIDNVTDFPIEVINGNTSTIVVTTSQIPGAGLYEVLYSQADFRVFRLDRQNLASANLVQSDESRVYNADLGSLTFRRINGLRLEAGDAFMGTSQGYIDLGQYSASEDLHYRFRALSHPLGYTTPMSYDLDIGNVYTGSALIHRARIGNNNVADSALSVVGNGDVYLPRGKYANSIGEDSVLITDVNGKIKNENLTMFEGMLSVTNGVVMPLREISGGSGTVIATDYTVLVAADITDITLPAAASHQGRMFRIVNLTGTTPTISAVLLNSGSVTTLPANAKWVIQSDGTDWYVVGE